MSNAKAKTIHLLLEDGTLSGIININDSAWGLGEMYAAPRESVKELASLDKYGVYLLLSDQRVYIGQSSDLERRIKQHLTGKDWWDRVVLLTTQDDSFTRTDIDYLESVLIDKAEKAHSLDSDNKSKGNDPKVNKFQKVNLDQYLEEAIFLMELIGINVFTCIKEPVFPPLGKPGHKPGPILKPALPDENLKIGKYVKTAMENLQKSGYQFTKEQIALYSSVEGSRQFTTRSLPMFWMLQDGETHSTVTDENVKRYWSEVFQFGEYRFLMYSQWYSPGGNGATIKEFVEWYNLL